MPVPKAEFDELHPCDFYEPADVLEAEAMYTVAEIARLLQRLEPDAEIDADVEAVLIDWAIPWILTNADDLLVGDPQAYDGPGYYGLRTD